MENKNDILSAFSEAEIMYSKKFVKIVIILYAFYNIILLYAFFVGLKINKISLSTLLSSNFMVFQTLVIRLLPIAALVLFITKKKAGWVLILLFSIMDLLFKSSFFLNSPMNLKLYMQVPAYLLIPFLLLSLLSLFITIFILLKSVTHEFKITNTVKFLTILSAIAIFFSLKFYLLDLIRKFISTT